MRLGGWSLTACRTELAKALALATFFIVTAARANESDGPPCLERQLGHCGEHTSVVGLPAEAPRSGTVVTVDLTTNTAFLFRDGGLIRRAPAATGSEKLLRKGSHVWLFRTPRGRHKVLRKIENPVWRKPDWAFVEEGKPIPKPNAPARFVKGKLGKYALDLGDGILIHGSDDVKSFGRKVSHGCVRLPDKMLETVYSESAVGTDVYIFESGPPTMLRPEILRAELQAAIE